MPGLSHEPEGEGCIEEVVAVEEIHACAAHGALDLFLEVMVDAEALQVVDGGHRHLPAAPSTSKKSLSYIRDASLVCQCKRQWWRVRARVYYIFFQIK